MGELAIKSESKQSKGKLLLAPLCGNQKVWFRFRVGLPTTNVPFNKITHSYFQLLGF